MEKLKKYILQQVASNSISISEAKDMLLELDKWQSPNKGIAIVGMAGRFPKAPDLETYWNNLMNGKNCMGELNDTRKKQLEPLLSEEEKGMKNPYQIQGYLDDISSFNASHFNISPGEAKMMDPCQRQVLEVAYQAIEDAGYCKEEISGSQTGVFIGKAHLGETAYKDIFKEYDTEAFTGTISGIIASRISYTLNLKGPSVVVDTVCSSGLLSVHLACQSINAGQCEMAIAGGVSINIFPIKSKNIKMLESPDSVLRPFSKKSNGTVWGEGASAVVLKPLDKALEDGDRIYAVIKGSYANNDGASNGIAAPNFIAQEELLLHAWENSGVEPESISYIEAHGTGTKLGDPIEIKGITNAFRRFTKRNQFCGIGTVKSNVGHLVAAAGLAGLIKVVLSMKHEKIPRTINVDEVNPYISIEDSPVFIVDKPLLWEKGDKPRRAGISCFGLSGTNCHIILEEAPNNSETRSAKTSELLQLSKRTSFWPDENEMKKGSSDYTGERKESLENDKIEIELLGKADPDKYTEIEQEMGIIWAEVLGYNTINIYDNFYQLGGDSILMFKILSEIKNKYHIDISANDFISRGTISGVSEFVEYCNQTNRVVAYPIIQANQKELYEKFPLTNVQLAYLVGRDKKIEGGDVATHVYLEFETELDLQKVNRSLQKVIKRHPMLRAIILKTGEQKILDCVPEYKICIDDISSYSEEIQQKAIEAKREVMSHHVLNTEKWPLFEIHAMKCTDNTHWLFVEIDMLIADGFSLQIIGEELMDFYYNQELELEDLDLSFRDYIFAYNDIRRSEVYSRDKEYWLSKLEEFPLAPELPLKKTFDINTETRFQRKQFILEQEKWNTIKESAKAHSNTSSAVLLTIYAYILSYWSNQSRFTINMTVFNRYPVHEDINKVVGDFTSIILLEVDLTRDNDFWKNVENIQVTLLDALEHRHFEGVELIREIARYHNMKTKAIMPVVFTSMISNEANHNRDIRLELGTMKMGVSQTPQVYLDFQATELAGDLSITWDYVEEVFDNETIQSMFEQYTTCLEKLCARNTIFEIKQPEWSEIITKIYNNTYKEIAPTTISEAITSQILRTPNSIAVEYENEHITYIELHKKSNQVANYLKTLGVKTNELIGVEVERRIQTIVNIIGIIKAGAAYVPIDPQYPKERKEYIIAHSQCNYILTTDSYFSEEINKYQECDVTTEIKPEDIAYVIYTSGSTGDPKGVVITHGAAMNTILDINARFHVTSEDRIIGLSSMCFDLSVYDIFGALSSGATLVLIPDVREINALMGHLRKHEITIWNSVPAIMDLMLENSQEELPYNKLRLVLLSGDWIPINIPNRIKKVFHGANVISLGGATEASIWSIYYPINDIKSSWKSIPYGIPLANQYIYILGNNGQTCPVGTQGEIYIGGVGVASGYYKDDERTQASFVMHKEYGRIYKTGDYGVLRKEGYIEFLGRKDQQIKVRGYRIEIGEIERKIQSIDIIKDVIVLSRKNEQGSDYICAYLTSDEVIEVSEIRKLLVDKLPEYMIPTYFVQLDKIPLTPNGKVDRKSLPMPNINEIVKTSEYKAPRNLIEEQLVDIWSECMGVEQSSIGINDNFFELGGDSAQVIKIQNKLEQRFPGKVSAADLFVYQTISDMANYIGNEETNEEREEHTKPLEEEIFNLFEEIESGNIDINTAIQRLDG